jgi:hypothetical protein
VKVILINLTVIFLFAKTNIWHVSASSFCRYHPKFSSRNFPSKKLNSYKQWHLRHFYLGYHANIESRLVCVQCSSFLTFTFTFNSQPTPPQTHSGDHLLVIWGSLLDDEPLPCSLRFLSERLTVQDQLNLVFYTWPKG